MAIVAKRRVDFVGRFLEMVAMNRRRTYYLMVLGVILSCLLWPALLLHAIETGVAPAWYMFIEFTVVTAAVLYLWWRLEREYTDEP